MKMSARRWAVSPLLLLVSCLDYGPFDAGPCRTGEWEPGPLRADGDSVEIVDGEADGDLGRCRQAGVVELRGAAGTALSGLRNIRQLDALIIRDVPDLVSLSELSALVRIRERLIIQDAPSLERIGLDQLIDVPRVEIRGAPRLSEADVEAFIDRLSTPPTWLSLDGLRGPAAVRFDGPRSWTEIHAAEVVQWTPRVDGMLLVTAGSGSVERAVDGGGRTRLLQVSGLGAVIALDGAGRLDWSVELGGAWPGAAAGEALARFAPSPDGGAVFSGWVDASVSLGGTAHPLLEPGLHGGRISPTGAVTGPYPLSTRFAGGPAPKRVVGLSTDGSLAGFAARAPNGQVSLGFFDPDPRDPENADFVLRLAVRDASGITGVSRIERLEEDAAGRVVIVGEVEDGLASFGWWGRPESVAGPLRFAAEMEATGADTPVATFDPRVCLALAEGSAWSITEQEGRLEALPTAISADAELTARTFPRQGPVLSGATQSDCAFEGSTLRGLALLESDGRWGLRAFTLEPSRGRVITRWYEGSPPTQVDLRAQSRRLTGVTSDSFSPVGSDSVIDSGVPFLLELGEP